MTIPSSSLYPSNFDTDTNLFLVHDSLRVQLAEDYNPGDKFITVSGDTSKFPPTGLITLTEQCSDVDLRAISFYYGYVTATTFGDLEILPGFTDFAKPKILTNVTENVMAEHHENLKNAIIAIEKFIGVKGTTDLTPLGDTMEGRTNFLQNLVLKPRAWFSADTTIGIVPLNVTFDDLSFRNPGFWEWCFGDGNISSVASIIPSVSSMAPSAVPCVIDTDGKTITHTYYKPGYYDVSLTVTNSFGTDTFVISNFINARAPAPDEADIEFSNLSTNQLFTSDPTLATGGVLKSPINTIINLDVTGNGQQSNDPIIEYTWKLGDQLEHLNSPITQAMYDTGGLYDVKLKVNTQYGAYRTTIAENAIDIIENYNLWLSIFPNPNYSATKVANTYEFGLLSETFKTSKSTSPAITRDYSFLTGAANEAQQKKEFLRNCGFHSRNSNYSGNRGTAVMYWSTGYNSGTQLWTDQRIKFMEYEGFSDCYATAPLTGSCNATQAGTLTRAWNWTSLNTLQSVYFLLGNTNSVPDATSSTNQNVTSFDMQTLGSTTNVFTASNYTNGATELINNVDYGNNGNFSVYRSTWFNSTGFIMRNDANGVYFRIKSFYQTSGTISNLVQSIQKLNDIPSSSKTEGQIVSLVSGIYLFNNSGEVLAYSPSAGTWSVSSSATTSAFNTLRDNTVISYQDPTISNAPILSYDNPSQRLIVTSDGDRRAYISFDYSNNTFIKFNEATKTFSTLVQRPAGEQWQCAVY